VLINTGSVKDRAGAVLLLFHCFREKLTNSAKYMLEAAISEGLLKPGGKFYFFSFFPRKKCFYNT
jgi:cysteine synthase